MRLHALCKNMGNVPACFALVVSLTPVSQAAASLSVSQALEN